MATRYGFLSTHPPTFCGLASFNAALAAGLPDTGVVRVVEPGDTSPAGPEVTHTWATRAEGGWRAAADALNSFDVAIIQHEYGIYPGADGADVLRLMRRLSTPSIVVLHTVLSRPTPRQKSLLEQIVAVAGAAVTMTATAHERLLAGYSVDPAKVSIIPHGAAEHTAEPAARTARPHMLTWGLLGPGKGIEWAIRAMAHLGKLDPVYTVAGRTHPKVLERHGETYRAGLHQLAAQLGLAQSVRFEADYLDPATLSGLIRSADVVVLPYDSVEQVTSGVLIEAVAAGVPVVATAFPHAVELLSDGTGLVVPHQNPRALSVALRKVLSRPTPAAERPDGTVPRWPAVTARYEALAARLIAARTPVPVGAPA
ncbi:glycosyltransferase [Actinoplanes sp. L3-i22]|uniref:glycosyltransferase n=1 Tax=Actinoplanes sp. L3-i22 TaxID=2836373 RepID=UPI001C7935DC|nr:glycosyltransferase [Actinoplanes sp. L3-i22]BCY11432.1 glycosyl transferase family 1 [Actinoplanes sp. L3-i22]